MMSENGWFELYTVIWAVNSPLFKAGKPVLLHSMDFGNLEVQQWCVIFCQVLEDGVFMTDGLMMPYAIRRGLRTDMEPLEQWFPNFFNLVAPLTYWVTGRGRLIRLPLLPLVGTRLYIV